MTTTVSTPGAVAPASTAWRTRDIVVTAIIGVTFGVGFWAWNLAGEGFTPVFAFAPPAKDLLYAVWLIPAVLAPLIVRKPGAALFAEMVAAGVSTLIGSQWGPDTLLSGFVQGAAAELVFASRCIAWDVPGARRRGGPRPPGPGSTTGSSGTRTSRSRSSWSARDDGDLGRRHRGGRVRPARSSAAPGGGARGLPG
jgi:hypothetical protein